MIDMKLMDDVKDSEKTDLRKVVHRKIIDGTIISIINMDEELIKYILVSDGISYLVFETEFDAKLVTIKYPRWFNEKNSSTL